MTRQRTLSQTTRTPEERRRHIEAMPLPGDPGFQLNVYTAAPDTPTADGLRLLASWAASQDHLASERAAAKS